MEKTKKSGRTNTYLYLDALVHWKRNGELFTLFEIQIRRFDRPPLMFDCTCINDLVIIFGLHNKQRETIETHPNLPTPYSYLLGM